MESSVCQSMETDFGQQTQNQNMDCAVFIFWVSSLWAHRGWPPTHLSTSKGTSKAPRVKFRPDGHKCTNTEFGTMPLGATWAVSIVSP